MFTQVINYESILGGTLFIKFLKMSRHELRIEREFIDVVTRVDRNMREQTTRIFFPYMTTHMTMHMLPRAYAQAHSDKPLAHIESCEYLR